MRRLIPTAAPFLLVALLAAAAEAGEAAPATLTVSATGEVAASPDVAVLRAGVETEGKTASTALEADNARVAAVLAALTELGIDKRDLHTGRITLTPVYASRASSAPGTTPRIVGYRAVNAVVVRVHDIGRTGEVLDRVVAAGANRLAGLAFTLDDPGPATDEARRRAVAEARRRAALYARAAGVTLKRILSISEAGGAQPLPLSSVAMRAEVAGNVPVEPGRTTVRAQVTIIWEIGGQ